MYSSRSGHYSTQKVGANNRNFRLFYKDLHENEHIIVRRKNYRDILSMFGSFARVSQRKRVNHSPDGRSNARKGISHSEPSNDYDESCRLQGISIDEDTESNTFTSVARKNSKYSKKNQLLVTNVNELREAILDHGMKLRELELKYSPPASLVSSKKNHFLKDHKIVASKEESVRKDLIILPGLKIQTAMPDASPCVINNITAPLCSYDVETEAEGSHSKKFLQNGIEATNSFSHDVLSLLHARYHSQSLPMARESNDTSILALAIEGGGMRGAVSGGMAAAICCLGLSNAFDSIYGSSAGSIIGSYFVSRQLYLDVYTDVIPSSKDLFVSKAKIIGDIFRNMFVVMKASSWRKINSMLLERFRYPISEETTSLLPTREGGLNISFVLDSIMCPERGLRPLDLDAFAHNDEVQPLRIVSSAVDLETGVLTSVCFGSKEGHFRDALNSTCLYPEIKSSEVDGRGYRRGLWACLGASMTVPGAAGSPFRMELPSKFRNGTSPHLCFDSFCYEPIPFRSAVAEGATHVLALRSRPAGFEPRTKPTLYERAVAPFYFRSHGLNTAADFFENGGQQYISAEDIFTCDQGLDAQEPVLIPPAGVLYAAPEDIGDSESSACHKQMFNRDRNKWEKAYLLPITVPADIPELSTLSQDRDEILAGIRSGFAAAYNVLAPVVGLEVGPDIDGDRIAELVFPSVDAPVTSVALQLPGEKLCKNSSSNSCSHMDIPDIKSRIHANLTSTIPLTDRIHKWTSSKNSFLQSFTDDVNENLSENESLSNSHKLLNKDKSTIISMLPGIQGGGLPLVYERLQLHVANEINIQDN